MIRRFNRWELKYMIPASKRDALLPVITAHMGVDKEGGETGTYLVNSLYWDTIDRQCYRAKLDGVNFRRKLRIRRYGVLDTAENPAVMVEIKQRINRTTQKRRLHTPLKIAMALCEGTLPENFDHPYDRTVAEEVMFLAGAQQLNPACVIAYERQAFVGSIYEPGLRITFDRDLTVGLASGGLGPLVEPRRFLPPDWVILEVKSNDVVPIWVSRLLAAEGCILGRFSKYCSGVAQLLGRSKWMS